MSELFEKLADLDMGANVPKESIVKEVSKAIVESGYNLVELEGAKPWGAYFRIDNDQADMFIGEFFPSLNPEEARGGRSDLVLTPKFLLVSPAQRLSWQYHNRRKETWRFLTDGSYNRSVSDDQGEPILASSGDVVIFQGEERHRLNGLSDSYALVAEIWGHIDPSEPSDEADIIRLADDYNRAA